MKEKDSETKKIMDEMEQLKDPFKDSALLKLEMEKLELSESDFKKVMMKSKL